MMKNYRIIENKIVDCVENIQFHYGNPTKKTGAVALHSINSALQHNLDIIVTPPIVKDVIRSTIPDFVGHTEYLAHYFRVKNFAMVGLAKGKRIMLLTTHLPLRHIFRKITPYCIAQKIVFLVHGLQKYFKLAKPRIGVCALNPHAFEFSKGEDEKIREGIVMAQFYHGSSHYQTLTAPWCSIRYCGFKQG